MSNLIIETQRLRLLPMTYEFVSKILENDCSAYEELGVKGIEAWPKDADIKDILHLIKDDLAEKSSPDGFGPWLITRKEDFEIVGDVGIKGTPDKNGVIDIGYGITKSQRRKGFGYEAIYSLLKWTFDQQDVKAVTADCLEDNISSLNLLKKLGMQETDRKNGLVYFKITNPAV